MNTTTRNVLIVIIVLLLIAVGILAWLQFGPKVLKYFNHSPSPTATSTPVSTATSTPPSTPVHIVSGNQYYTADVVYPSSTPLLQSVGASADAQAIAILKGAQQNAVSTFVQDGQLNKPPQGEINSMAGQKYSLGSAYQLYTGARTISYVYTINEDTLGAHPNSSYLTFTFDSQTGQQLPLYDLFRAGSDYLDAISSSSRVILTKQLGANEDPTMVDPGTTADNDNFSAFAIDGSNLDIFFAPYQVASYAQGPQVVKIPLSQLSNILEPQYQ